MNRSAPDPDRLLADLPEATGRLLAGVLAAAGRTGAELAWAGGGIRDLLRGEPPSNVDLVVVGDALPLARRLATDLDVPVKIHPRFGTATLELTDGSLLDLATARRERYAAPGALPEIEPSSLVDDLARRDFTANALALRLTPAPRLLLDPHRGWPDLRSGILRVLHRASFVDDPTRILRGVRFEARLGWRFEPETERLAREALSAGALAALSGDRLRRELRRTCENFERLSFVWDRFHGLGLLAGLDPELPTAYATDEAAVARVAAAARRLDFAGAGRPAPQQWLTALLAIAASMPVAARGRLDLRLDLDRTARRALLRGGAGAGFPRRLPAAGESAHVVTQAFTGLGSEELCLVAAAGDSASAWVTRYLTELSRIALRIGGEDLVATGLPSGPHVGEALRATLDARLDGRIGADDELAFALGVARRVLGAEREPGDRAAAGRTGARPWGAGA